MKIIIDADESSPIVNPCFVVKNWDGKKNAVVKINDSFIEIGNNNRQGIVRDTDGIQMMVVWLKLNSAVETIFELERSVQK